MNILCKVFGHSPITTYYENNMPAGGCCDRWRCAYKWGEEPKPFGVDLIRTFERKLAELESQEQAKLRETYWMFTDRPKEEGK